MKRIIPLYEEFSLPEYHSSVVLCALLMTDLGYNERHDRCHQFFNDLIRYSKTEKFKQKYGKLTKIGPKLPCQGEWISYVVQIGRDLLAFQFHNLEIIDDLPTFDCFDPIKLKKSHSYELVEKGGDLSNFVRSEIESRSDGISTDQFQQSLSAEQILFTESIDDSQELKVDPRVVNVVRDDYSYWYLYHIDINSTKFKEASSSDRLYVGFMYDQSQDDAEENSLSIWRRSELADDYCTIALDLDDDEIHRIVQKYSAYKDGFGQSDDLLDIF